MDKRLWVAALALFSAPSAWAASVTDVADANDVVEVGSFVREDLWDVHLGSEFGMELGGGKITREPIDLQSISSSCSASTPRDCLPVDELKWSGTRTVLRNTAEVGLFQDLALTVGWTYVLSDTLKFGYAKNVDQTNSTVDRQTQSPSDTLFAHNFRSKHGGSGPLDFGMKWAPLSDLRDDTKPSWLLSFKWTAPYTAPTYKPTKRASPSSPGSVGDGVHKLAFDMAFSKRMGDFDLIGIDPNANRRGFLDPYVALTYTMPVPDKSRALKDLIETRSNPFGRRPSHVAEARVGLEVVPIEDLKNSRKVSLDFGLTSTFQSEGRNYTLLTDPLKELTYEEQHLRFGGLFGIHIQAAEFVQINAGLNLAYTTEHFLTFEEAGEDKDGDGSVSDNGVDQPNKYFCGYTPGDICSDKNPEIANVDQVGFRFKDGGHTAFSWFASLVLTF